MIRTDSHALPRRRARAILFALASFALLYTSSLASADEPGRRLFDGRLDIAGYAAFDAEFLSDEQDGALLSDLALFLDFDFSPSWRTFAEVEVEDAVVFADDEQVFGDAALALERLYIEGDIGRYSRVRVGQMLTPLGIWNRIHADPLVWTTARPAVTQLFFDAAMTGVEVETGRRLGAYQLTGTLFGQASRNIDDQGGAQETKGGGGGVFAIDSPGVWRAAVWGFAYDDDRDRRWETTVGFDVIYESDRWELTSEFAFNDASEGGPSTWGMYAQAVYHAPWRLHPILRIEHLDLEGMRRTPIIAGIAFKPTPSTILKLEAVTGSSGVGAGGNGVLVSAAILF